VLLDACDLDSESTKTAEDKGKIEIPSQ